MAVASGAYGFCSLVFPPGGWLPGGASGGAGLQACEGGLGEGCLVEGGCLTPPTPFFHDWAFSPFPFLAV